MRLSLVQITVGPQVDKNFQKVDRFINQALSFKPDLILLPECFLFLSNLIKRSFTMDHEYILHYQNFAKINKVNLLLGSLPILDEGKVYNRSILINQEGNISSYYDKIHMFDVVLSKKEKYFESNTYSPGNSLKSVKLPWGKLGLSICYDLRFPMMYRKLAKQGALFLSVPSSFTLTTGKKHWHTLLQARAIENFSYVFAPAQTGTHFNKRQTFGHSLIISPDGAILAEKKNGTGFIMAEIDSNLPAILRQKIPSLNLD